MAGLDVGAAPPRVLLMQVIVTAASAGIGKATAEAFLAASETCVVAVTGRDLERLKGAFDASLHSRLRFVIADDFADVAKLSVAAAQCVKELGGVDVLVNNLGAAHLGKFVETSTAADLLWHFNINVTTALIFTQACVASLEASKGAIINFSSIAGVKGIPGVLPYCVAKGALDQLTRCSALELAPKGIRVTAVAPATVETTFHDRAGMGADGAAKYYADGAAVHPLGRCGRPEEVAAVVLGLAAQTWTTGSIHYVDGGRLLTMATAPGISTK